MKTSNFKLQTSEKASSNNERKDGMALVVGWVLLFLALWLVCGFTLPQVAGPRATVVGWGVGTGDVRSVVYWGTNSGGYQWSTNVGGATNWVTAWSNAPMFAAVRVVMTNGWMSDFSEELALWVPVTNYGQVVAQGATNVTGPWLDVAVMAELTNVSLSGVEGAPRMFWRVKWGGWWTNWPGVELGGVRP